MALAVSQSYTTDEDVAAEFRFKIVDIVFDNNYPSGGYPGGRALVGMSQTLLALVTLCRVDSPSTFNLVFYNLDKDTIRLFGTAEIVAGTNLTGVVMRCLAIGK